MLVAIIFDSAGLDLWHMTIPSVRKAGTCGFGADTWPPPSNCAFLNKEKQTNKNNYRLGK